jgi:hypothetical protein
VIVLFSAGASEIFAGLPDPVKRRAARSIELLTFNPHMYPIRRRGIMRGYRYFVAYSVLFYYTASSTEIRVSAILPGRMRRALLSEDRFCNKQVLSAPYSGFRMVSLYFV